MAVIKCENTTETYYLVLKAVLTTDITVLDQTGNCCLRESCTALCLVDFKFGNWYRDKTAPSFRLYRK